MKRRTASHLPPREKGARPEIVTGESIADLTESIYRSIATRAYKIYETRGRQDGHDLEDWFRAEAELLRPIRVEISGSNDQLTVQAELPGFRADEIKVGIEPHRVIVWVKKEDSNESQSPQAAGTEILRVIDLPSEIDPTKAVTTLQGSILDLTLPRVMPAASA